MDWSVELSSSVDKEELKWVRETLEAKLKAESGQYGEAARILWELLVQIRHTKNSRWECLTMIHMGKVYRALRWSIAVSLFEDALELAEAVSYWEGKLLCFGELGEMKCQWGQFEDSLELLRKALSLVQEGELATRRLVLLDMVMAYEGLDDLTQCRCLLQEVIEIDRVIGSEELAEDMAHLHRLGSDSSG
jgi:tetratricopeptide (TPR) repeat protein